MSFLIISDENAIHRIVTSLTKHYLINIISPTVAIFEIYTQGSEWKRY